jgi:biotin carboxylase
VHRVRVLFPTMWDRRQLQASRDLWARDHEVVFEAPDDADCDWDFDALGLIDGAAARWRGDTHGVFSSSDYPGAPVAAAVAAELSLPGTAPAAMLRASHKSLARSIQARSLPEATPAWQQVDPDRPSLLDGTLGWPCWVKPSKGTFSVLARRVASEGEMGAFLRSDAVRGHRQWFLNIFAQLVRRYIGPSVDAATFVVEQELRGRLVTVEGWVGGGEAEVLGVVDSVLDPASRSFVAFEHPSSLPAAVQQRMRAIARRLAAAFELRWTLFNVELTWDEATDRIGIVELNPRMCGQFADLHDKVAGRHGYRVALDLACGRAPLPARAGTHAFAASYPLRVFEPVRVLAAPDDADVEAAQALFPGTLVWNEVRTGDVLADFAREDGHSHRYAVVNVGASSAAEAAARRDAVVARLGYRFESAAARARAVDASG